MKKVKYCADLSERSMQTAAKESSNWRELDLESFIFCPIFYNVPHTWLQEQQKDDAHVNESATTQLESESASTLMHKKV